MMNSPAPPLTQVIGQTEKTMNAILDRHLAGAVSEPEWVTLVLMSRHNGSADRDRFTDEVADALKISQATATGHVGQLISKGLVQAAPQPGSGLTLSDAGHKFQTRMQVQVGAITERLWGDLPAADLVVMRRVLGTILERADAELKRQI
jgi:DNA-binding MarR family transcriptional regulator